MFHEPLLPVIAALALTAAPGPRLDVKPGLWEVKTTSSTKMEGDLPAADLSKAPPEMRARLEAMRDRMKSGKPHTTVLQSCVTQEDIDKGRGFDDDEKTESCERRYLDRTSKHIRFKLSCGSKGGEATSEGEFDLTVKSADLVLVHGDMKTHAPQHDSASTMEVTARRLGSSCGDVKPGQPKTISQ